jgi:ABC-type Fe3+ transport system substrate-binding protein
MGLNRDATNPADMPRGHLELAGRLLIGYNLLASYAYERVRRGDPIGIVMPSDYTLVLSHGAMVPSTARHEGIAVRFIDYLLSARGRAVGKTEALFFASDGAPPEGIEGQDAARRKRFLKDWPRTIVQPYP